jgi:hypothetical protein
VPAGAGVFYRLMLTVGALLAWLQLLALDGGLANAEPKKLPHPPRRCPHGTQRLLALSQDRRSLALGT